MDDNRWLTILCILLLVFGAIPYFACNTKTCEELCTYNDRRFDPAHTVVWYTEHCMSYGKNGNCNFSVPVRHEDHIPDRWFIQWQEVDGAFHETQVGIDGFNFHPAVQLHKHFRWKTCRRTVR